MKKLSARGVGIVDAIFVLISVGFFLIALGYVKFCEKI